MLQQGSLSKGKTGNFNFDVRVFFLGLMVYRVDPDNTENSSILKDHTASV